MAATFAAKYDGVCPECRRRINVGDLVCYTVSGVGVVHVDCNDPNDIGLKDTDEVCPRCHCVRPCFCD